MKKRLASILAILILFSFTGCLATKIRSNDKDIAADRNEACTTDKIERPLVDISNATPVSLQEAVSIADVCEFTVEHANLTIDVIPPQPDSFYTHYEADDNKVYVDICIAYKNLDTRDKDADKVIDATLLFGRKYEYTGFSMIEKDDRSDFTYSNITRIAPLTTGYIHYLFQIPEELESSNGSLLVLFKIDRTQYSLLIRDGIEGDVATSTPNAIKKTEGDIYTGEVIAVDDHCEFSIDFTDITDDVRPPQPGDFYSHYEADEDKVYVDLCIAYRNLETSNVDADETISATLTYAGKYEYDGFSMIEKDDRSDFTYSNITNISPLTTEYMHYLFEVPAEVETSSDSLQITFTIGGNTYTYTIR